MSEILFYLIILLIGMLGSFIGTVAAGAALISVPGLLLLGIPPHVALASSKLGGLGFRLGSLYNYSKHNKIVWDLLVPLSILGILGSVIGANILVEVNEEILSKLIGVILLILLPLIFFNKKLGIVQKQITKTKRYIAHFWYFILKIWMGFFPPGSGFMSLYLMTKGYGLTILQSKGTTRIPSLISDFSAVIVFALASLIDYKIGMALIVGEFIGSWIGSHVAIKKGDEWIKPLMGVIIIIVSVKMIFF